MTGPIRNDLIMNPTTTLADDFYHTVLVNPVDHRLNVAHNAIPVNNQQEGFLLKSQ